jgi:hypothetical protein
MREICPSGSVEGVMGNHDPYSDMAPAPRFGPLHSVWLTRPDGRLRKSTIGDQPQVRIPEGSGSCSVVGVVESGFSVPLTMCRMMFTVSNIA